MAKKKEITARQIDLRAKKKYDKEMKGKKTVMVKPPSIPNTYIEKVVE